MDPSFRKSMAWLHTWAGVVLGSLLLAVFWMGTLSVFDREIDRWMMPGTRLAPPVAQRPVTLEGAIAAQAHRLARGAPDWSVRLPDARVPAVELRWRNPATKSPERRYLHPQTGAVLGQTDSLAGTGFIFAFHHNLNLKWLDLGYWLVGLAGMAMLALIACGVVIHRRLVADFFLFRPHKNLQRATLDLHNLCGVLALPVHFVLTLSGLVILFGIYWPGSIHAAYPQAHDARQAFTSEAYGPYRRAKAQAPLAAGPAAASLDAMVARAESQWQGGKAGVVRVWHPGDRSSYVEVRRGYADSVTMTLDQAFFDAGSGALLHRFEAAPAMAVQRFVSGLHRAQWDHGLLRWLYFAAGLAGCVLIATGFVFWIESRRAGHAGSGLAGVRVVEALAVFSVPGIVIATLVFFTANRLLHLGARVAGMTGDSFGAGAGWDAGPAFEVAAFYLAWLLTLAHAALRARAAWREQALAIAVLAPTAVALNWASTGHHLGYTLAHRLPAVAGMDLLLLATALVAALAARRLARKDAGGPTGHARDGRA